MKFEAEDPSEVKKAGSENVDRSQGAARAISVSCRASLSPCKFLITPCQSFIDPGLQWSDLDWFKSITKSMSVPSVPLCLQG